MPMRMQKKPDRPPYDTRESRNLAIKFKKKYKTQAYWILLGTSIASALQKDKMKAQLAIQAAYLLKLEGYDKYPMAKDLKGIT